jgi:hypothetical protein
VQEAEAVAVEAEESLLPLDRLPEAAVVAEYFYLSWSFVPWWMLIDNTPIAVAVIFS